MIVKTLPLQQAFAELDLPDKDSNLFSSFKWLGVIEKTYGARIFVKCVEQDGRVESFIIYSVVHNFLEWKICMCSYCDYCDGRVRTKEHWQALFDDLRKEYPQCRIALRNLRDEKARECGLFEELSRERFHLLDVRGSLEDIWRRGHDSHKAAVSQARRKGVTVRKCEKKELRKFFQLHLDVRKNKYRIFPQPFIFFENIWDAYMPEGKGFLLGAFSPAGDFIGGNVYLVCGDTLYYKFNTSHKNFLDLRPNNILFWEGICLAKRLGLSYIDLGSSGFEQKGLIRFKEHIGAEGYEIVHLGFHPPDYKFSQKRILRTFTSVFTHPLMPDQCVRWGSRIIYHYLA